MLEEEIKRRISEVYGKEIRYPKDCDLLAEDITQKTGLRISPSTTKRLLGFIKSESRPSQYTLDTIANYIGFKNWSESEISESIQSETPVNNGLSGKNQKIGIIFGIVIVTIIGVFTWYFLQGNRFTKHDVNFKLYPELPEPRSGGRIVRNGNDVFFIGGVDAEFARNNNWRLNLMNKVWYDLPILPTARAEMATVILGNKIYCFGGWLGNKLGMTSAAEVFDIIKNQWDSLPDLPVKLTSLNAVVIGADIYILGGTIRDTKVYFYRYNIEDKTYHPLETLRVPRMNTTLTLHNGKIYSCGGNSFLKGEYKWHSEVEQYDPQTNIWKMMTPMPMALSRSSAFLKGNEIHVIGGSDKVGISESNLQSTYLIYHVSRDCWENYKPISVAIAGHQCIEFNDTILILGGNTEYPNPNKKVMVIVK